MGKTLVFLGDFVYEGILDFLFSEEASTETSKSMAYGSIEGMANSNSSPAPESAAVAQQ